MREFHIGDVLSVVAMPLVSPRGLEGVSDLLSFMTGEAIPAEVSVLTAAGECMRPRIVEQLPELREFWRMQVIDSEQPRWLQSQIERFGDTVNVIPI